MRQKSETTKTPSERVVKDIRRATRKHHSAEEESGRKKSVFICRRTIPSVLVELLVGKVHSASRLPSRLTQLGKSGSGMN